VQTVRTITAVLYGICAVAAGNGEDPHRFEAASVKRTDKAVIHNSLGPGTVILRGDPLKLILSEAFQVKVWQIAGPSWLDEDRFEIVAKMPEGASQDQVPAMLQTLLAERFRLAAHKENQPRPVYALVIDKGGPKFREATLNFRRFGVPTGGVMFRSTSEVKGFKGAITVTRLAQFLSGDLDRPVLDFTGLPGIYDIDLSWAFDPNVERRSAPGTSFADATEASGNTGLDLPAAPTATIFTAVRDSLGLRLEARKEPVEILVIDHVERVPTEN